MLINFCQKSLETVVSCSTVSNDDYEITNLINDTDKGFLAYSCIKPPIHIDFTFICDIQLSRVIIWPIVGAQKSSGFEISIKSNQDTCTDYRRVSTGFLNSTQIGVLFYRRDIDNNNDFREHNNFLKRYIQVNNGQIVNNTRNLRISIVKTENSVPAIKCIQVWGRVSQNSSRDTITHVYNLSQRYKLLDTNFEVTKGLNRSVNADGNNGKAAAVLEVPESFLDPITWSIMIQPIVLPSGVTIDQSTLEKHGKTEATWGRTLSDPFTGMPFSETRKPVVASALKARIDKFLLDNKDAPDVMNLPRLSGTKQIVTSHRNRSIKLSDIAPEIDTVRTISSSNSTKTNCDKLVTQTLPAICTSYSKNREETRIHRLPVVPMSSKRVIAKRNSKIPLKLVANLAKNEITKSRFAVGSQLESNLDRSVQNVLSNLQRFDDNTRTNVRECLNNCACSSEIFYKLPCNHVVCKDVLITSAKNLQCAICGTNYSSRDPERVHNR